MYVPSVTNPLTIAKSMIATGQSPASQRITANGATPSAPAALRIIGMRRVIAGCAHGSSAIPLQESMTDRCWDKTHLSRTAIGRARRTFFDALPAHRRVARRVADPDRDRRAGRRRSRRREDSPANVRRVTATFPDLVEILPLFPAPGERADCAACSFREVDHLPSREFC